MSINWVADIAEMHRKYGVKEAVANFDSALNHIKCII